MLVCRAVVWGAKSPEIIVNSRGQFIMADNGEHGDIGSSVSRSTIEISDATRARSRHSIPVETINLAF